MPSDFGSKLLSSILAPGSVLYFKEESHDAISPPHYFVVLNDPQADEQFLLVCATSQKTTIRRYTRSHPVETVVEVSSAEYSEFSADKSFFNCNKIYKKTLSQLEHLQQQKGLSYKKQISKAILERLIVGVLASPAVKREHKKLLK